MIRSKQLIALARLLHGNWVMGYRRGKEKGPSPLRWNWESLGDRHRKPFYDAAAGFLTEIGKAFGPMEIELIPKLGEVPVKISGFVPEGSVWMGPETVKR